MDFKKRKISHKKKRESFQYKPKDFSRISNKKITISASVLASLAILMLLVVGIVKAVSSINVAVLLTAAGDELQTDVYGHSNFLILGTGGFGHEGGDLTDAIIVASLDPENKTVSMLSIPRDLWVKDETIGNSKINEIYYNAKNHFGSSAQGLDYTKDRIEDIVGMPIHYWIKIDFKGFTELIDAIGGVNVNVKQSIYDPYYPKDGTFEYETFSIQAGPQQLDGETALKYARSRKTTSDFDRAERQQDLLYAIKEKATSLEIITNTEKIEEILNTLKSNIETNIKVKEIITLGGFAADFQEDKISHRLIHDDPNRCGGFLYTPERQYYGGLFVLLPAGGVEFLHDYSELNFSHPEAIQTETKIHILNGTASGGIAGEAKQILKRFCFTIERHGNAATQDIVQTTYYYKQKVDQDGNEIDSRPPALDFLQKMIPGVESTDIPEAYLVEGYIPASDIILEIGSDYVNSPQYINDPFYSLQFPIWTPESDATEEKEESIESNETTETPAE